MKGCERLTPLQRGPGRAAGDVVEPVAWPLGFDQHRHRFGGVGRVGSILDAWRREKGRFAAGERSKDLELEAGRIAHLPDLLPRTEHGA